MHLGAQIQAAVEVLGEVEQRHRPAADALRDWGRSHRFAGSGDRAVIGNLVFDCLRRRRSLAEKLGDDGVKLAILGVAVHSWGKSVEEIAELCTREHGPGALSDIELAALGRDAPTDSPVPVQGDIPDWLESEFTRAFGAEVLAQTRALSARAPIDLRVNTLKADRAKVLRSLSRFGAVETPYSPVGLRIAAPAAERRSPNVEAEAGHGKGWFEVQDEGSQIAALLAGATPGAQVMDLCAGAGGKTLALSAAMQNKGQVYAYDRDRNRLRKIFERLKRSGARNVQVMEAGDTDRLSGLENRMDLVLIDAPCTGSGTWRRRPDAKWRLSPEALDRRCAEQREVLATGAALVRPGGRLVYVTCSLLPQENEDQINAFTTEQSEFVPSSWRVAWSGSETLASSAQDENFLQLTPQNHGTDGFFVAVMERRDAL